MNQTKKDMTSDDERIITITRGFDYRDPIGYVCLKEGEEITPNSSIFFAFQKKNDKWKVIGASLICDDSKEAIEEEQGDNQCGLT